MRIAISGGIAEGKSTILAHLKEAGYAVASADAMAAEVFASEPIQTWLTQALGNSPTRESVRNRMQGDREFRHELNARTHPLIWAKLMACEATFIEVPLLVEACLFASFDRVWVATCGLEIQRQRLSERLGSMDAADELLKTQLPTSAKLAFADRVVRTNLPLTDVLAHTIRIAREDAGI